MQYTPLVRTEMCTCEPENVYVCLFMVSLINLNKHRIAKIFIEIRNNLVDSY